MILLNQSYDNMVPNWILVEKSKSKSQQRFMGMVRKCQKTGDCGSSEVKKAASGMSDKDAEDFASTKHAGLPEKVESLDKALDRVLMIDEPFRV